MEVIKKKGSFSILRIERRGREFNVIYIENKSSDKSIRR